MLLRVLIIAVLFAARPALAGGLFYVTNGADSGPGSLRQAILDANEVGPCAEPAPWRTLILFEPRRSVDDPPLRIQLETPLPFLTNTSCPIEIRTRIISEVPGPAAEITGPGNGLVIHYTKNMTIRNVSLRGFPGHGVVVVGSSGVTLENVEIENNGGHGVVIIDSRGVTVRRSEIHDNGQNGVFARNAKNLAITATVHSNRGNGVHLHDVQQSALSSLIEGNAHSGVLLTGDMTGTDVSDSTFRSNGLLAVDIGADGISPNKLPVLESAALHNGFLRVAGTVQSTPATAVKITLYGSDALDPTGFGEGAERLTSGNCGAVTDAAGRGEFVCIFSATKTAGWITAISSSPDGPSELSRGIEIGAWSEPRFVVTTTEDSGPGSLRFAIEEANESDLCHPVFLCRIEFAIDSADVPTITPVTPLPPITANGVVVDGGGKIELSGRSCHECNGLEIRKPSGASGASILLLGMVINDFDNAGVSVIGPDVSAGVRSSLIGTDPTGTRARPNGRGVWLQDVSYASVVSSVISGNHGDGITVERATAAVSYNKIGTDRGGLAPLGNGGNGVVSRGAMSMEGNLVAFNRLNGVRVPRPGSQNWLFGNAIHSNGALGIDMGEDGVTERGDNVVDTVIIVSAHADGEQTRVRLRAPEPMAPFVKLNLQFFIASFSDASGHGEGRDLVPGRWILSSNEEQEIALPVNLTGKYLSAVVTQHYFGIGETFLSSSEFSNAMQVSSNGCPTLAPQILGTSLEKDKATIRWSALPVATEYRIWVMPPRDQPQIAYRGPLTEATIEMLPHTEWWIESRFHGCYGTQSEHRVATVITPL